MRSRRVRIGLKISDQLRAGSQLAKYPLALSQLAFYPRSLNIVVIQMWVIRGASITVLSINLLLVIYWRQV